MTADPDLTDGELDALVDTLLANPARPVAWSGLPAAERPGQWAALDGWVRWLAGRYALDPREIPPCWYRHGPLVEELSALRTAHVAAYDSRAQPTAPADWHHTLAATRSRLHDWVARTGCRPAEHRHDKPQPWADAQPPAAYTAGLSGHVHAETGSPGVSGRTGL